MKKRKKGSGCCISPLLLGCTRRGLSDPPFCENNHIDLQQIDGDEFRHHLHNTTASGRIYLHITLSRCCCSTKLSSMSASSSGRLAIHFLFASTYYRSE